MQPPPSVKPQLPARFQEQLKARSKLKAKQSSSSITTLLFWLAIVGFTTFVYYGNAHPDLLPDWAAQLAGRVASAASSVWEQAAALNDSIAHPAAQQAKSSAGAKRTGAALVRPATTVTSEIPDTLPVANEVTLVLTNGRSVTGSLLRETPQIVTLGWDYGEAEFPRREIAQVFRGRPASPQEPAP